MKMLTMQHTKQTPRIHNQLRKRALIEQLVDDDILIPLLALFERGLDDEGTGFMACEGGPLACKRLVYAMGGTRLST